MKNLAILLITFSIVYSCQKKETSIKDTTENTKVISEKINYKPIFSQTQPLQNINVQEAERILAAHDNDTIYVTNFFATWCGPCMREIPYFKEKIKELKGQKIKFTFISIDEKEDWQTAVKDFGNKNNLSHQIVLLDGKLLSPEFFTTNFKEWDGSFIPYTCIRKRNTLLEIPGSVTPEVLHEKIQFLR